MRPGDVGQDADGGLDDGLQRLHFARLGNARLDEGQLVLVVHPPDGQGDADLRIIAAGRTHRHAVGREQLVEPLLHHGLAVAARDAHHRNLETRPMVFGQLLQGFQRSGHHQVVGIRLQPFGAVLAHLLESLATDDKIAHSPHV